MADEVVHIVIETYFGSPGPPDISNAKVLRSEERAKEWIVKAKENKHNRFCSYHIETHTLDD